jgi:hypothetical protein
VDSYHGWGKPGDGSFGKPRSTLECRAIDDDDDESTPSSIVEVILLCES